MCCLKDGNLECWSRRKKIVWSKETTSTQLEMRVVNCLTENYSTKWKLRCQASHTKKRNIPLMFIFTWLMKSLSYIAFFLKVTSLKTHFFNCHQTVRSGFSVASSNSLQLIIFNIWYSWLCTNLAGCCDRLPQFLEQPSTWTVQLFTFCIPGLDFQLQTTLYMI